MKKNIALLGILMSGIACAETAVPTAPVPAAEQTTATTTVADPTLATTQQAAAETTAPATQGDALAVQDPTLAQNDTTQYADSNAIQAPEANAIGIFAAVNVGTQGIGMDLGYEFNKYLKLRVRGAYLGYSYEDTWSDVDVELELNGSNFGVILDTHPFGNGFRISTGLNFSGLSIEANGSMALDNYDLAGKTYNLGGTEYRVVGSDGYVNAEYKWNRVQPYIGIGWSSDGEGDREVFFSFDLGINFIGTGNLSIGVSDNVEMQNPDGSWSKADTSTAERSLREEGKDFFKIADDLCVYPVLQLGMGFRF